MSYSNGLLSSNLNQSHLTGQKGDPGIGFNLTSNGNYDMSNKKLENIADGTTDNSVVSKKWITDHVSTNAQDLSPVLKKDGSVQLTSNWTTNTLNDRKEIFSHHDPTHSNALCRRSYVNNHITQQLRPYLKTDGSEPLTANWDVGNKKITNVSNPSSSQDVVTKSYLETNTIGLNVNSD